MATNPTIDASVTFLATSEGGRSHPALNDPRYRPHIVVGSPDQRVAITANDKRTLTEEYLGIWFSGDGSPMQPGLPHDVSLALIYYPHVGYDALVTGATFTIREGSKIVGFGRVKRGIETVAA